MFARLLCVITLLAAAACGMAGGSGLTETGNRVAADVHTLLAQGPRQSGALAAPARPRVHDVVRPCPDGGRRRVVAGSAALNGQATMLAHSVDTVIAILSGRGYRLTGPPTLGRAVATLTFARDDPAATLTVRLRTGRRPSLAVTGATACMAGS